MEVHSIELKMCLCVHTYLHKQFLAFKIERVGTVGPADPHAWCIIKRQISGGETGTMPSCLYTMKRGRTEMPVVRNAEQPPEAMVMPGPLLPPEGHVWLRDPVAAGACVDVSGACFH